MHRYRVCMLKLVKQGEVIAHYPVVKADLHISRRKIYLLYRANVAVEDSRALLAVVTVPLEIIVVLDLHYAVALAEDTLAVDVLLLTLGLGIERALEHYVEVFRAGNSLARRSYYLNAADCLLAVGARESI